MPELRALLLGVPAVLRGADREHPLLGARLLLVAARAAERRIEAVLVQRLLEALGLPDVGMQGRAVVEGVDPALDALGIDVHQQLQAQALGGLVAEGDHLAELPGGVHVQQGEGRLARGEGLHRQVQHDRAVLADGVEHHRVFTLGDHFADDLDAFGFQALQVSQHRLSPWDGIGTAGCGPAFFHGREAAVGGSSSDRTNFQDGLQRVAPGGFAARAS
ncbi:hypothetical protein D9M71_535110 [compost metagenome]